MNKTEWKKKHRAQRLKESNNFGIKLGKLMTANVPIVAVRGNEHIWKLRDSIAAEVDLVKKKRVDQFDN